RHLDRLVKLRLGPLLDHLHRLVERIELGAVDALAGGPSALSWFCHGLYPTTSRPIDRAEPSTIRMAASIVVALRSFIFFSSISFTCALVTWPTAPRPGVFAPLWMLAAFLRKWDTGGVLSSNVNERSAKMVMTTGVGAPFSKFCVCALNALQNSMMLRPRWRRAGPIGGEGFAAPAGTCSFR